MAEGMQPVATSTTTGTFGLPVTIDLNLIPEMQNGSNPEMPTVPNYYYYQMLFVNISFYIRVTAIPLSLLGLVTNTLNMAVFSRLMDSDTVSVSLFGMALSDFLVCLTTLLGATGEFEQVQELLLIHLSVNPRQMVYYCIVFPNVHFARATLTISAFITFERCLCVAMPLKVKSIFTSRRVKIIMLFCFLFSLSTAVPYYATYYFTWTYFPPLNKTILGYSSIENYKDIVKYSGPFIIIVVYILLFVVIIVCTMILIVVLNKKMIWRKEVTSTTATSSGQVSAKEIKVIKMMVMVASLFIACNAPCTAIYLTNEIDNSVSMEGSKQFMYYLLGYFVIIIQTFNSSVNIFIYYFNSTNYKLMFDKLLGIKKKEDGSDASEKK